MSDEAERIASHFTVTDAVMLEALQELLQSTFLSASSRVHGGAAVYLDAEGRAIWNDAAKIAMDRWLAARKEK